VNLHIRADFFCINRVLGVQNIPIKPIKEVLTMAKGKNKQDSNRSTQPQQTQTPKAPNQSSEGKSQGSGK
jgi:hypothetical protein